MNKKQILPFPAPFWQQEMKLLGSFQAPHNAALPMYSPVPQSLVFQGDQHRQRILEVPDVLVHGPASWHGPHRFRKLQEGRVEAVDGGDHAFHVEVAPQDHGPVSASHLREERYLHRAKESASLYGKAKKHLIKTK